MGQIKVIIQGVTGAQTPAELPDDVPIKKLIPALLTKLNWPKSLPLYLWELDSTSPDIPIRYVLDHRQSGQRLQDEDTLTRVGVNTGDTLVLLPSVGHREFAPVPIEHHIILVSGRRFSEAVIVVALRAKETTTALIIPKRLPLMELEWYISAEIASSRKRHFHLGFDRPWLIYNETANMIIDDIPNLTVGDVISSGDLLRIIYPQDNKPTEESQPTIRITPEDLEGNSP